MQERGARTGVRAPFFLSFLDQEGDDDPKKLKACFGILVGGILAFDEYPRKRGIGRPWARTAFGFIAGLGIALIWPWHLQGQLLSMAVGSALGYFGMLWAQWM